MIRRSRPTVGSTANAPILIVDEYSDDFYSFASTNYDGRRMKLKFMLIAAVALLSLGGIADAAGVFSHEDSNLDIVQQRAQTLEGSLQESAEAASTSRLRRGPRGPKGVRGPKGAPGQKGGNRRNWAQRHLWVDRFRIQLPDLSLFLRRPEACAVGTARAECPVGTTLIGGGYTGAGIVTTVTWNAGVGNGWALIAVNLDEVPVSGLKAVAQCAAS